MSAPTVALSDQFLSIYLVPLLAISFVLLAAAIGVGFYLVPAGTGFALGPSTCGLGEQAAEVAIAGAVGDEEALFALIRERLGPSRLFTVASKPFYQVADRVLGSHFLEDIADFIAGRVLSLLDAELRRIMKFAGTTDIASIQSRDELLVASLLN